MASHFPSTQFLPLIWVFQPYLRLLNSLSSSFPVTFTPILSWSSALHGNSLSLEEFWISVPLKSLVIQSHSHHCLCVLTHSLRTLCLEISSFTLLASLLYRLWFRLIFSQSRHCQYPQFSSPIIRYSLCAVTFNLSPSPQTLYSNRTKSTGSSLNVPCCYRFLFLCLWHSLLEIPVIQRYI